jgi:hypothetical protein
MAFNVNNFRANFVGQGARPNLFEVTVPFPGGANPGEAGQKMTFMCKGSQIPGGTIGTVEANYFGRVVKLAGNRTFDEWTTNVINDEDFAVHAGFVNWMNYINSHEGNLRSSASTDYQVDAVVRHYSKDGNTIKEVTLRNAWPTAIPAIELDWATNDSLEEFAVTWAYDYWDVADDKTQTT